MGYAIGAMAATVVGLYVVGFVMLSAAIPHHYHLSSKEVFGLGTGILALTLGMRHAFDADHIAAIDNTTRKLMSEGKRPLSVGFFFSLGHSSIVFVMAVLLELRHPLPGRAGEERQLGSAQHHEHRRDRGLGILPLPDRRVQRRHPGLDPPGVHGACAKASTTTRSSSSSSTSGG